MIIKRKINGSAFSNSVNELIDKDQRFDELPEEFIQQLGDAELYERDTEVYKYNDRRADF